jgi:quinol-cytochrome oxidoreductase complex cytochrome b subunit
LGSDVSSIPERDKPFYLTLILLAIFSFIVLGYGAYLASFTQTEELRSFIQTVINIVVGWCGIGLGYYLRGKASK